MQETYGGPGRTADVLGEELAALGLKVHVGRLLQVARCVILAAIAHDRTVKIIDRDVRVSKRRGGTRVVRDHFSVSPPH